MAYGHFKYLYFPVWFKVQSMKRRRPCLGSLQEENVFCVNIQ